MTGIDPGALRAEFERLMTIDSATTDARRRDYNMAIFSPAEHGGRSMWVPPTDLGMVLDKYDRAVRNLTRKPRRDTVVSRPISRKEPT